MNDQSLIHLLKADPEEGLRMAISLYGKAIKTICSSILRDAPDEDIEEAVSDTFVAIWQSARNFRMDQGVSFKSYCYGIARKKSSDQEKNASSGYESDAIGRKHPVSPGYHCR